MVGLKYRVHQLLLQNNHLGSVGAVINATSTDWKNDLRSEKMHNLTKKQISESIECCVKADCKGCPLYHYKDFTNDCEKHIITMLKDENERLNSEVESLQHYKPLYEDLKAEHLETIREIKTAKFEAVREFSDKVNLIVEELVDIMFDGNEPKCKISNCHKHSSIPCESPTCIEENKAYWKVRILNIVKEMVGDSDA